MNHIANQYWTIWPFHPNQQDRFKRAWDFDQENGCIAIGWRLAGDLSGLSLSQIKQRLVQAYGEAAPGASKMLLSFYNEIAIGDEIIAVGGRDLILGRGIVTKTAFHDDLRGQRRIGSNHPDAKPNFIGVEWHSLRSITPSTPRLSRWTIAKITAATYFELVNTPSRRNSGGN